MPQRVSTDEAIEKTRKSWGVSVPICLEAQEEDKKTGQGEQQQEAAQAHQHPKDDQLRLEAEVQRI